MIKHIQTSTNILFLVLILVIIVFGVVTNSIDIKATKTMPIKNLSQNELQEYECLAKHHKINLYNTLIYGYPDNPYFYQLNEQTGKQGKIMLRQFPECLQGG